MPKADGLRRIYSKKLWSLSSVTHGEAAEAEDDNEYDNQPNTVAAKNSVVTTHCRFLLNNMTRAWAQFIVFRKRINVPQ